MRNFLERFQNKLQAKNTKSGSGWTNTESVGAYGDCRRFIVDSTGSNYGSLGIEVDGLNLNERLQSPEDFLNPNVTYDCQVGLSEEDRRACFPNTPFNYDQPTDEKRRLIGGIVYVQSGITTHLPPANIVALYEASILLNRSTNLANHSRANPRHVFQLVEYHLNTVSRLVEKVSVTAWGAAEDNFYDFYMLDERRSLVLDEGIPYTLTPMEYLSKNVDPLTMCRYVIASLKFRTFAHKAKL